MAQFEVKGTAPWRTRINFKLFWGRPAAAAASRQTSSSNGLGSGRRSLSGWPEARLAQGRIYETPVRPNNPPPPASKGGGGAYSPTHPLLGIPPTLFGIPLSPIPIRHTPIHK